MSRPEGAGLPKIPGWFQDGFHRFLPRFFRRQFDAMAVARENLPAPDVAGDGPLIVFGNHPSWWDPLVAHVLNRRLFPGRQFRAPIDAEALNKYQVFAKLGFFGIEAGTRQGAAEFLRTGRQIVRSASDALWLTPEGRFADVRDHGAELMPGLSHLCHSHCQTLRSSERASEASPSGTAVPATGCVIAMALEYVFWNERLPVCLVRFSPPARFDGDERSRSKAEWHEVLTAMLRENQNALAERSKARCFDPFEVWFHGKSGGGFFYDSFRRAKSWIRRERFDQRHESRGEESSECG